VWVFLKRLGITLLKVFVLAFVGVLGLFQIPELRYDFGPRQPMEVANFEELAAGTFPRSTFVSIHGTPDFEHAFTYRRYGLPFTYFNVEPYGLRLVVRSYDKVTDEWKQLNRFLGRLRPFERQPFSYRIRQIYREKMKVEIPADAFFLALDDVPRPSGWQLGAVGFSAVLWLLMLYLFFVRGWRRGRSTRPKEATFEV
jgi:hypothetical protein